MCVGFFVLSVCIPNGSYSEDLDGPGCARVNLDVSVLKVNSSEKRARVLDIELVVFKFEHLVFVHIIFFALLDNWLDGCFKYSSSRVV